MNDEAKKHLHSDIIKNIEHQEEFGGVDTRKLNPGMRLEIQTKNTLYKMEITKEPGQVILEGGRHAPEATKVYFAGSTWGGSMLKMGWIGHHMHMEINLPDKVITTSPVQGVKLIGDGWQYEFGWQSDPEDT
jgi:hypothetical protein